MDPFITDIISGVIANCLTGLGRYLGGSRKETSTDKQTELQALISKATEEVAQAIDWEPPPRVEEVCLFLMSPEVESIVRQIISSKLLRNGSRKNLESIETEFMTSFALFVGVSDARVKSAASTLFRALFEGCEREFENAIDRGILSAHEAKSTIRYRILLDEVEAIKRNISFLSTQKTVDVKSALEFEGKYRRQVSERHGYIIPPHFDSARKIPIDDLYVMPRFIKRTGKQRGKPVELKGMDLLANIYRSIILGDPGSGKSSFAIKLCHELSNARIQGCFCRRRVTPILILLRDYGAEKKAYNHSIIQHIEGVASSRYQLTVPGRSIEYLLLNGRSVIIFDGLDELLDTSYRQEISNDIESFCTLYPSVPVLVISRSVGYEQAPLDERKFEVFDIAEFDDSQVQEYVTKWFATEPDFTTEQRKQKVNSFLSESLVVRDLRSNPLTLALMCNIYRGENYIPKNRPDVYEKCAMMLFERWDLSRGIHVQLPFEAHIKPAMMHLAHWIYNDDALQGGVTEHQLINEASRYLLDRRFEDVDQAKAAAREFIDFCRGRAWVFSDIGTTKEGEGLYQFTHRTFLEYFTASHLFRTHPTAARLEKILLPRIIKREWDAVAQLSFQILNKNIEGAGDELLKSLLHKTETQKAGRASRWNLLSFAARCLQFIVPSPRLTRDITSACIRENLDLYASYVVDGETKQGKRTYDVDELISNLLNSAVENLAVVKDELVTRLVETAKNDDKAKSIAALETGLFLPMFDGEANAEEIGKIPSVVYDSCTDIINKLRKEFYTLCVESFIMGKMSMAEIIELHGVKSIFMMAPFTAFENRYIASIAAVLTGDILVRETKSSQSTYDVNKALEDIGSQLLMVPLPFVKKSSAEYAFFEWWSVDEDDTQDEKINLEEMQFAVDETSFLGIFILLAVYTEALGKVNLDDINWIIKRMQKGSLAPPLRTILRSRLGYEHKECVEAGIKTCGLSSQEEDLVWRWSQKEIDFVEQ